MLTAFANGTLFGVRTGDAPQVLALHGWGGDSAQLAAAIAPYPSISLDLPGFGASPAPDKVWGAAEYAAAVAPVLGEFERPPVIVGFSFGGRVALHLASAWPQRVGALVLTGAPLLRRQGKAKPSFTFRALKKAHQLGLLSDDRMEAERRKRGSADYRNASGVMREVLVRVVNESYEEQLANVACHVEMVWGADDTAATVAMAEQAKALLADVNLTVVSGRNHHLPTEEPTAVSAAIARCLS